jgi:hypothetical protein
LWWIDGADEWLTEVVEKWKSQRGKRVGNRRQEGEYKRKGRRGRRAESALALIFQVPPAASNASNLSRNKSAAFQIIDLKLEGANQNAEATCQKIRVGTHSADPWQLPRRTRFPQITEDYKEAVDSHARGCLWK